jgi:hypothetical protein
MANRIGYFKIKKPNPGEQLFLGPDRTDPECCSSRTGTVGSGWEMVNLYLIAARGLVERLPGLIDVAVAPLLQIVLPAII